MKIISFLFLFFYFGCHSPRPEKIEAVKENVPVAEKAPRDIQKTAPKAENCICIQLWMPVCGENGKTYSNSCFAKCAGVAFKQGACGDIVKE